MLLINKLKIKKTRITFWHIVPKLTLYYSFATSLIFVPVFATSCSSSPSNNLNETFDEPEINDPDQIFPKIDQKDYHHLIQFEGHIPIITDELKLQFIKDVINRVSTSKGQISFNEQEISKQHVIFIFKWEYKNKILFKNYEIKLNF